MYWHSLEYYASQEMFQCIAGYVQNLTEHLQQGNVLQEILQVLIQENWTRNITVPFTA